MIASLLAAHVPLDEKERRDLARMRDLIGTLERPFQRDQPTAHFTGSAVVVDPQGTRVCLLLHRKLNRWLQPGGHMEEADGGDVLATAMREAREELGLAVSPHPSAPRPLDVDVHVIPARKGEPEHSHLDVRFLLVAPEPEALRADVVETGGAAWLSFEDALARADEPAMVRMLKKAQALGA